MPVHFFVLILTLAFLIFPTSLSASLFDQKNSDDADTAKPILMINGQTPQLPEETKQKPSSEQAAQAQADKTTEKKPEPMPNPNPEYNKKNKKYQYDIPIPSYTPDEKPLKKKFVYEFNPYAVQAMTASPDGDKTKKKSVYVNISTKKYHKASCRFAKGDKIRRINSEEEAVKRGYIPCKRCIKKKK